MCHEPWEPCDAPPAPEPRSVEEWLDYIGQECHPAKATERVPLCRAHILRAMEKFADQECAALRERSNQNALDHAKTVDERNALQQRVEALEEANKLFLDEYIARDPDHDLHAG